jgi:aromatic ring-opening dioxygenase catalytic subunit (LigB family)
MSTVALDETRQASARMPAIFIPHGGGPWPWMDMRPFVAAEESRALADYLTGLPAQLPRRPRALLVISAHWEAPVPTVMTNPRPPIYYDYYNFPEDMYRIPWPAPGDPQLAARVRSLLTAAGFASAEDAERGFDHGTFVPLKLTFPDADVPTIQLSLENGLDPARHIALGRALAPLRQEGVLIVGSGMSYHNLREMRSAAANADVRARAREFDTWLREVMIADPIARDTALTRWTAAPSARQVHPREEHLLPLMVVAGAAGADRGRVAYQNKFATVDISAAHFGD